QSAETARQVELMSERLLILQNDRDRLVERVDALEANALASRSTRDRVGDTPTRPALKVVKLVPNPEIDEQRRVDTPEAPVHAAQNAASGADELPGHASATETPATSPLPTQVE